MALICKPAFFKKKLFIKFLAIMYKFLKPYFFNI